MSHSLLEPPAVLPFDRPLHTYLSSPAFLTNHVWKIAFSPCSQYLAIPKQDIHGRYCLLVLRCSDWHSDQSLNTLPIEHQFHCTSAIWSLAFGQRKLPSRGSSQSHLFNPDLVMFSSTPRDSFARRRSTISVNRRHDFTKHLFLAAGLADGKINIYDVDTGELTLILKDHQSTVCGLDFTSCTMQLASCSYDTTIKLWNLLDDEKLFASHTDRWLTLEMITKKFTVYFQTYLFPLVSRNMYKTLKEWDHVIHAVKWSPDETLLCVVGPFELVILYDTKSWEKRFKLDGHLNRVVDCAFSSDSALLVTASHDTRVLLWSTTTGELLKAYAHKLPVPLTIYAGGDNDSFVRSLVITNNNQFVITTCDDNKVRWFPLALNRSATVIYERTENNVLCVATAPNGQITAISTSNGEVHLLSSLSTRASRQVSSMKYVCRLTINSHVGRKRKDMINLPIAQHLINYLLYKDIKMK